MISLSIPDIPAQDSALRVAIVAGADTASNASLTTPPPPPPGVVTTPSAMPQIDRVVGFAGCYPDVKIPLGPVVQVRRDDQYRQLGIDLNSTPQVVWRCAYYITKETPIASTSPKKELPKGGATLEAGDEPEPHTLEDDFQYEKLMDTNLDNEVPIVEGAEPWGGQVFGFDLDPNIPPGDVDDVSAFVPYDD